jgi:hypothetical protein
MLEWLKAPGVKSERRIMATFMCSIHGVAPSGRARSGFDTKSMGGMVRIG